MNREQQEQLLKYITDEKIKEIEEGIDTFTKRTTDLIKILNEATLENISSITEPICDTNFGTIDRDLIILYKNLYSIVKNEIEINDILKNNGILIDVKS